MMKKLTEEQATKLFWRIGDKQYELSAHEATNERISVFSRMAVMRRRLVDNFNANFRERPEHV